MTQNINKTVGGEITVNYQYDGRKERILKTVNGGKTLYLRGMNDYPLTEKTTSLNRFYVYGPTGLIAVIDNGTNYFILKDHPGSTHVVLDEDNAINSWYDYTPYGKIWDSQISEDSRYRFAGQEYDPETNLLNFRARMYDPILGIFYAGDSAGQGFSPYMYCGGNPTMYVDKDGRIWWIPIVIGAVVGGYAGGSLANHSRNPLQWDWNSHTWQGIGFGALGGAIAGSGIAAGGLYGTATNGALAHSVGAMLNGANPNDIWKYAITGFITSGFGAWAPLGELGWAGKFAQQALSTSLYSMGNNWAHNRPVFSNIGLGIGPLTFRLGKGQRLLDFNDYVFDIGLNVLGGINTLAGGTVESFDFESLTANYTGGFMGGFISLTGNRGGWSVGDAVFHRFFNSNIELIHELRHVWQSRYMTRLFGWTYGLNYIRELIMDTGKVSYGNYSSEPWYRRAYLNNYLEELGRGR